MKKIYYAIALFIISTSLINAQITPTWEFYKTGFEKFYYTNVACSGTPSQPADGYRYCKSDFMAEEHYSGFPDNFTRIMKKDNLGNFYFAYDNYLAKQDVAGNWKIYSEDNSGFKGLGLSQDYNITEMIVDADNNIWASTMENGLMKFDGTDFTYYDFTNSDLPYGFVNDLILDSDNNLWIAMYESGLVKFDRNDTWTFYDTGNTNLPSNYINSVAIDGNGFVWVANASQGEFAVAKFDGVSSFTAYDENNSTLTDDNVYDITADSKGDIWISLHSQYGHVAKFDIVADSIINYDSEYFTDYIHGGGVKISADNDTSVYFSSSVGLTRVNINTLSSNQFGTGMNDNIYYSFTDADGQTFFSKTDGVYSIINEADSLIYSTENNEMQNFSNNLLYDSQGLLWGVTDYGELQSFDGENSTQFTPPFDLNNSYPSRVQQFAINSNDNFWMIVAESPYENVVFFDGATWEMDTTVPISQFKQIVIDNSDNVWISTWGEGLAKYDGSNWTVYDNTNSDLPNNYIQYMTTDKDGNIILNCMNGPMQESHLVKYDGTTWTTYTTTDSEFILADEDMGKIEVDKDSNVYFSYRTEQNLGFIMYNGTTWTSFNAENSDLPSSNITDIAADALGNLWISSYSWVIGEGGIWHLSKFDGESFFNYDTEGFGVSGNAINSILPDNAGNIWMMNGNVLVKLNEEGMNEISGILYYDENDDCILDETETGIGGITVKLINSANPQEILITTTNAAGYYYFAPIFGEYTIEPILGSLWTTDTDNTSSLTINMGSPKADRDFCLVEVSEIYDYELSMTSGQSRCSEESSLWLNYKNTGTSVSNGDVTLVIDELNTFITAIPAPTTVNGNILTWNYADMNPGTQEHIWISVEMPDFNAMGDTLMHNATITDENDNTETTNSNIIVLCSYDPNDKVVKEGVQAENYVLFGDELTYTIRFQNTGNDTAYVVVVEDSLDIANLDINSFKFISASHDVVTELDPTSGLATFTFTQIMLVDSTTNEQNSQGYVEFTINAKTDIAEFTVTENDAYIYFDFNPAIVTNEVFNTIVGTIPEIVNVTETNESNQINVFPNPNNGSFNINTNSLNNYSVAVYNILGDKIYEQNNINDSKFNVNIESITSGIYFLQVKDIDTKQVSLTKIIVE